MKLLGFSPSKCPEFVTLKSVGEKVRNWNITWNLIFHYTPAVLSWRTLWWNNYHQLLFPNLFISWDGVSFFLLRFIPENCLRPLRNLITHFLVLVTTPTSIRLTMFGAEQLKKHFRSHDFNTYLNILIDLLNRIPCWIIKQSNGA